ncbi:putative protein OS=Streptomyces griseus subsp. griseus (strain JCM 4626 / NBRC) OX=455632 GN=SGR_3780 PE=4 SV=1 [Streptomyces griseus subsp. griseus]
MAPAARVVPVPLPVEPAVPVSAVSSAVFGDPASFGAVAATVAESLAAEPSDRVPVPSSPQAVSVRARAAVVAAARTVVRARKVRMEIPPR